MGRGDDERYNDAADERCIAREQREKDRREARYEALEDNFKKSFANLLRQKEVKKALALEARDATRSADGRFRGRSVEELLERGGFNPSTEGRKVTEEEAYSRPWEE